MTVDEAAALLDEWKEVLNLRHWDVAIAIVRATSLSGNRGGEINFQQRTLTAHLSILDPVDYPDGPFEQDLEHTIVHELLHLWVAPFQPDEDSELHECIAMEQAINKIADALVLLKRRAKKNK